MFVLTGGLSRLLGAAAKHTTGNDMTRSDSRVALFIAGALTIIAWAPPPSAAPGAMSGAHAPCLAGGSHVNGLGCRWAIPTCGGTARPMFLRDVGTVDDGGDDAASVMPVLLAASSAAHSIAAHARAKERPGRVFCSWSVYFRGPWTGFGRGGAYAPGRDRSRPGAMRYTRRSVPSGIPASQW